jgi:hypothetical protein
MLVLFLFFVGGRRQNQKRGTGVNLAPLLVRRAIANAALTC